MGPDAMILVLLNVEFWVSFFSLLLHLDQEAVWFLFAFCHEGGVICISEVVDTSPGNLDSSLCFIQPTTFGMRYWPASWETYMQVRKQQLELDMEQQTGSK